MRPLLAAVTALAAALTLAPAAPAHAAPTRYSLTLPASAVGGEAYAVNSSGEIAGYLDVAASPRNKHQPAVWPSSTAAAKVLPLPMDALEGEAVAINDAHVVLGNLRLWNGTWRAVTWNLAATPLVATNIAPAEQRSVRGSAINDKGEVAGQVFDGGARPGRFAGGVFTAVPGVAEGYTGSIADDAASTVVGNVFVNALGRLFQVGGPGPLFLTAETDRIEALDISRDGSVILGTGREVTVWRRAAAGWTRQNLGIPTAPASGQQVTATRVVAYSMSRNATTIVGYANFPAPARTETRAYRLREGKFELLPGFNMWARDVNDAGLIVGAWVDSSSRTVPVVWQ